MYSLSEIKTIKDEYEVEEVNCLERPVALLLHSFNPIYRNIYLMFEKMNRCYNLDYYADINYRDMISMQRATVVLKKEMDIQIKRTAEEIDIHDFVIDNISKNNPVIVPGNLKKLYYSKFYNKADWIHSFFVYGFDSENELYMVFDSVQCEKEKEMHKFVIPKDVLIEMYKSFCSEIYKEGIYYIESADVNRNLNCRDVFYNGMYQFVKNRKKQTFVEIDLIEDMFRLDKVKNDDVIKLLEINNFKKVFLNELVTLLEYFDYKEKDIDKLKQINRKLLDSWKVGESKIAYYLRKKKNDQVYEELKKPLELEKSLLKCILGFLDEGNIHSNKVNELINNIINNEDNIINTVDYQKYSFTFNNKRSYNNWFEDLAPRVIILDVMNYHNIFTFECDFEISKYNEWANFMFGVYIRDDKENTYLYGNNSMNSACFEHTGINSNVFENEISDKKYNIRVLYKDSVLQFIYTEYGDVIKEFKNEFVPYGDVNQIGITCKTWGNLSELELVADNIKIKVED